MKFSGTIISFILVFRAGALSERYWLESRWPLGTAKPKVADRNLITREIASAQKPSPVAAGDCPTLDKNEKLKNNESAPSQTVSQSELNQAAVLNERNERQISRFARLPVARLTREISRQANGDGSVDVSGITEDGRTVEHHFTPQGKLTFEKWNDKDGYEWRRGFYESGRIDFFSITKIGSDRALLSVSMRESGTRESIYVEEAPDGSRRIIGYDEADKPISVCIVDAENKIIKFYDTR